MLVSNNYCKICEGWKVSHTDRSYRCEKHKLSDEESDFFIFGEDLNIEVIKNKLNDLRNKP